MNTTGAVKKQPSRTRRTAVTIWTAMVVWDAVLMAAAVAVAPAFREQPNPNMRPMNIAWLAVIVALLCFIMSRIIPRRAKPLPDSTPDGLGVTRTVVASALNEASVFMGIVAWLLTGLPHAVGALLISLTGLLLSFPSASRWPSLCLSPETEGANLLVR